MYLSLKILLIALAISFAVCEITGDTLTYIDDKITVKGKIIEKNAQTIKFAINIFKKTSSGYTPLILTAETAKIQVVEEKSESKVDSKNEQAVQNVYDLCSLADKNITEGNLNLAFQNFEKSKIAYNNLSDEVKKNNLNLQKLIYQGLLRFNLLEFLEIIDNPRKFQSSKETIKSFSIAADITTEYIDYLQIKLNPLFKVNKDLIQELMRTAILIYRIQNKELLNLFAQNKNEHRAKFLQIQLDLCLDRLKTLFEKPESVKAMQALLNVQNLLKSKIINAVISQRIKSSEITKLNDFFADSVSKELSQVLEFVKMNKLFDFWFPEVEKASDYKNFISKIDEIEKNWGKSINPKNVSEVLNADIIQYKKDNEDLLNKAAIELNQPENELLQLINHHREMFGLNPLINKHSMLGEAARKYLKILAKMDKISHEGCDGSTPLTRAQKEGWRTQNVGENLYRGEINSVSAKRVFEAWLAAPLHNLNIINEGFDCCGIANSARDWILLLAGP